MAIWLAENVKAVLARLIKTKMKQKSIKTTRTVRPKVVFDVDDVLWPLGETIAKHFGIDFERYFHHFKITENSRLTDAEREMIIAAYADTTFFEKIEFFAGAKDILRPRELGAIVKIKSNSFSERIAELKIQQLLAAIPGLTEDDIQMSIIDYDRTHSKTIDDDTTIFVDDSPFNVATSPAHINIMPDLGGWNRDASAQELLRERTVFYAKDLSEINQLVYAQVKEQLKLS